MTDLQVTGRMNAWLAVPDAAGNAGYEAPAIILWVDPSEVAGWITWRPRTGLVDGGEFHMFEIGQMLSRWKGLDIWLGWEMFTIRPGTSRMTKDTTAPECIGMLRWLAHYHNYRILKPQTADARILGVKNQQAIGWYTPGKDDQNAAAAHLLSFALEHELLPPHMLKKILGIGESQ